MCRCTLSEQSGPNQAVERGEVALKHGGRRRVPGAYTRPLFGST